MKNEELDAIREQAERALKGISPDEFADEATDIIEKDVPKLIAEIERLRELAHEILNESDRAERRLIDEVSTNRHFALRLHASIISSYQNEINGVDDDE